MQKLDPKNINDFNLIYEFALERIPASRIFGVDHSQEVLMFHCINVFSNDLYYLKDENVIVIFRTENDRLHIYDIISKKEIDIYSVLIKISKKDLHEVVFHFTPDFKEIETEPRESISNEVLFIRTNDLINFPDI